jgi:hypothetical protein
MSNFFPVIELFDRLSIAEIKFEKTQANANELKWYQLQAKNYNLEIVQAELAELKQIHLRIWELEKELKSGTEQNIPLEEIGRRAIAIRNHNHERIKLKNRLAELLKCSVREIKRDHVSE